MLLMDKEEEDSPFRVTEHSRQEGCRSLGQERARFALSLACNLTLCGLVFMSRCQHPNCMSKCSFNYNLGYTLLNHCPVELKFYFPGLSPDMIFFFF